MPWASQRQHTHISCFYLRHPCPCLFTMQWLCSSTRGTRAICHPRRSLREYSVLRVKSFSRSPGGQFARLQREPVSGPKLQAVIAKMESLSPKLWLSQNAFFFSFFAPTVTQTFQFQPTGEPREGRRREEVVVEKKPTGISIPESTGIKCAAFQV